MRLHIHGPNPLPNTIQSLRCIRGSVRPSPVLAVDTPALPARRCPPLCQQASSPRWCPPSGLLLLLGAHSPHDSPTPQSSSRSFFRTARATRTIWPERQRALPEPVTLLPEPAMQTVTSFHEELAPLSAFSLSRRTLFCLASAHLTLSSARIKSRTPRRACRRAACTLAYQPLSARGHGPLLQAGRSCL